MNKTCLLLAGLTACILVPGALPAEDVSIEPPARTAIVTNSVPASDTAVAPSEDENQAPAVPPMRFETSDAAAMALIDVAASEGADALYGVLGSDLEELVSGDPVADAGDRQRFVELAEQAAQIEDQADVAPSCWLVPMAGASPFPWHGTTRDGFSTPGPESRRFWIG